MWRLLWRLRIGPPVNLQSLRFMAISNFGMYFKATMPVDVRV